MLIAGRREGSPVCLQSHVSWEQRTGLWCTRTAAVPGTGPTCFRALLARDPNNNNKQTNNCPARKNFGLSSMPAASRECFVDTVLVADGQHPCDGFCCCCFFSVVGSVLFSLVPFSVQVKKKCRCRPELLVYFLSSWRCTVISESLVLLLEWRLQPQTERCQLIKEHMSPGEITGEHFQSLQ